MPKIVEVTVYTFNELNARAKERARNWYRNSADTECQFAWEAVKEDAQSVRLELSTYKVIGYMQPVVTLEGAFIDSAFNCATTILATHGDTCDTYKTAQAFIKQWEALPDTNSHEARTDDADALEADFLAFLLKDYGVMLQKDFEYRESDQYIDDIIIANEYTFTEAGKRFRH